MKFVDKYIFVDERFSVGIEQATGKFYISIPVANSLAEYEEYYELEPSEYHACPRNIDDLVKIAEKSRARKNDARLIMQPGKLRGSPV